MQRINYAAVVILKWVFNLFHFLLPVVIRISWHTRMHVYESPINANVHAVRLNANSAFRAITPWNALFLLPFVVAVFLQLTSRSINCFALSRRILMDYLFSSPSKPANVKIPRYRADEMKPPSNAASDGRIVWIIWIYEASQDASIGPLNPPILWVSCA